MSVDSEILYRFAHIPIEQPVRLTMAGMGIEQVFDNAVHTLAAHPVSGARYVCAGNPHPDSVSFEGCAPVNIRDHFVCSREEAMQLVPIKYDAEERTKQPLCAACTFAVPSDPMGTE